MADDDVHVDEMDDLTPEELEYLLENPDEFDTHPVAVVFADLRSALQSVEAPAPGPALAEFLGTSASSLTSVTNQDYGVSRAAEEGPFRRRSPNARRKRKVGRSVAAIAATTTGKILLGTTAAAAAFGAAQVAGVVDLTSGEPTADVAAAGDASATYDNEFQVDAESAGTVGAFVEDGQVRLAGIASADGWNGRLKADTDTELLVLFENDSDDKRQVSVLLTLTELDPERSESVDISSFVTVEVTNEDGAVRTLWFGDDGAPLSNITELSQLVVSVDPDFDPDLDNNQIDLDAGVRVGTNAELDAQAGATVDLGTTGGADAGVQLDTDVDLDLDLDTGTGTNPGLGIGLGTDAEAQSDTNGVHVGADLEVRPNTNTGPDADLDLDLDTDVGVDADLDLDVGLDDDLDVGLDLDTGVDLGADNNVDLNADLDVGVDTGGDLGADVDLGLDLDADLDLGLGRLFGD